MPIFHEHALTEFAIDLLAAGGVGREEAALVGRSLVGANLRGHDSHGVMRIPYYLDALAKKEVVAGAPLTMLNESATLLATDGNWGFGQTQAGRLTERLIAKCKAEGSAVGTLVRSGHVGRLGEYCERAADQGLVSIMMVNTHGAGRRVAPHGGKAPRLGTNPLALGAPNAGAAMILDFGTSATAEGKVRVKRIAGQMCPDGWLLDSEGRPTNDPNTLYGNPPGTIRPMGGDQAYKGFGLALMIEIFAGAVAGGPCVREKPLTQIGNCVFLMLVDPDRLGGGAHYACEVAGLAEYIRSCPLIDGAGEIQLPGDPERRTLAKRRAEGIPLDDGNFNALFKLAGELKVSVPTT